MYVVQGGVFVYKESTPSVRSRAAEFAWSSSLKVCFCAQSCSPVVKGDNAPRSFEGGARGLVLPFWPSRSSTCLPLEFTAIIAETSLEYIGICTQSRLRSACTLGFWWGCAGSSVAVPSPSILLLLSARVYCYHRRRCLRPGHSESPVVLLPFR